MKRLAIALFVTILLALTTPVFAQDIGTLDDATAEEAFGERHTYSPYANQAYPTRVFWGDTHLHTALSVDATVFGATLEPEDAYRFARGEEVRASSACW